MSHPLTLQQKIVNLEEFIAPIGPDIASRAKSIDEKYVIEPNMPVGVYLQEAYNIHFYAQKDREILTRKGLDWGTVEELPMRIDYLRQCEAEWWDARFGYTENEEEFFRVKKMSERVRDELRRVFKHLATFDSGLKQSISKKYEGHEYSVLNADLCLLQALCNIWKDKLVEIDTDPQLIEDLNYCQERFPVLDAAYLIEKGGVAQQNARNEAYTVLLVAVEEVRRCARLAFWNDKRHLKGYLSEYFRKTAKKD
ncbi:MAG: hypothetical protein ACLFVQ_09400 [Chitinispirillaceae bacterium]